MTGITLRTLKNTEIFDLYKKLLLREELASNEREALLKIAVILINAGDENTQDMGYRIIVLYSNLTDDYKPLYDIAIGKGYIPIAKAIENREELSHYFDEDFFSTFLSSYGETYSYNGIHLTSQQAGLNKYFGEHADDGVAVIAPTSYGKSELFVRFCNDRPAATIAMVVPTKALLAQTRKRVLHGFDEGTARRKIITHPEMYNEGDRGFVAVLTQERLLRIIQNDRTLAFDYVFIDEAHNLLSGDQRNLLLAKVIALLGKRSDNTSFSFLTPFLVDADNLATRYLDRNYTEFRISEHLKTERYHVVDLRDEGERKLKLYDQYLDEFITVPVRLRGNETAFLNKYSSNKNIVYLNSPPRLERFAMSLAGELASLDNAELIAASEDISSFLHTDYGLLDCLKRGVIYHHGSVPDVVKLYIENLYSTIPDIRYVVSSSTLLEGVNIPADKLFLLECRKGPGYLSAPQFKNLVGRICRFSELFNPTTGSLSKLEPEVYLVASKYMGTNANIEKFIRERVKADKTIKDNLDNVLLEVVDITDENRSEIDRANQVLENLEPGITGKEVAYATTDLGKLCYVNNVTEFSILECEAEISKLLDEIGASDFMIEDTQELMEVLHLAFVVHIHEDKHQALQRLSESSAKRFYRMFLRWRMRNASYSEMIGRFLDYWDRVDDSLVYVDKWGDTARPGSHRERWVDVSEKSGKEKVNLAIVRIKEEQDFLDNQIMKFVEVLNDLELLDEKFYKKIKYGTEDEQKITMMKNGFSSGLASLLLEKYGAYLTIDPKANTVDLRDSVRSVMQVNDENRIYVFEASFFTSK
ncbi:DEAD/DEAH box helicase [Congregibacter brevis]|uniref:DEAD/DEAH box helicase n=1 Tax=Congregibacter brevis TaxID=3081201 RepID=A0ABZ0IGG5_9GAMM|nr:DEAD/DEAH box helicase [Congregibacter sp. IMCC45268]